jgi:glycosyltransferase 2 family protein
VTRLVRSRVVRLVVAAGLTGYLLWISHPEQIGRATAGAAPSWLLLACALVLVDRTLMAWRWIALLRPLTVDAPPRLVDVIRVFFVSTFVGTFLPASVGGDAVRAYSLSRHHVPAAPAVASVVMDRALGVVSILLLGLFSLAALHAEVPKGVYVVLVLGGVVSLGAAIVIFSDRIADVAIRAIALVPGARVRHIGQSLLDAVRTYRHHHGVLAAVLVSSVAVQVIRVLQAWCLGRALHIDAPVTLYFVTIPVILLIMLLPITVNGLGTSQAAFLWTFGAAGVARPAAFALSILFVALGVVGNLPGGLIYAFGQSSGGRSRQGSPAGPVGSAPGARPR